jgi:cell division protein ZapA
MAVGDKAKNKYYVKILDEELLVVGNVSDEYVNKLAEHINLIGEDIARAYPRLSRQRIMGLALMNIADEYYKLKDVYNKKIEDLKLLQEENRLLKEKFSKLRQEYDELVTLLEEAD